MVDVDGRCQFSADSQPKSIGLVWGLAATRRSVYIQQVNRVNSGNGFGHGDSTINIVVVVVVVVVHFQVHARSLCLSDCCWWQLSFNWGLVFGERGAMVALKVLKTYFRFHTENQQTSGDIWSFHTVKAGISLPSKGLIILQTAWQFSCSCQILFNQNCLVIIMNCCKINWLSNCC